MIPFEITGPASKPLLLMEPHAVDSRPNALAFRGDIVETPQGARIVDTGPAPALGRHELTFICENRAELAFLEAFFDARKAKAEAFWFPTWQWEFDVYGYDLPSFGSWRLWIRRHGYVEDVYPLGTAFRQLAILRGDRFRTHRVLSATASVSPGLDQLGMTDGGDYSTPDLWLLDGPTAQRDDSYRALWLRWGRFDQDELVAETINSAAGAFSVQVAMVELPAEVPL